MSTAWWRGSSAKRLAAVGKLGAWHALVTTEREVPQSISTPATALERHVAESPAFADLRIRAATALRHRADEIASRWESQARGVMLEATATTRQTTPEEHRVDAADLIRSLATALAADGTTADDAVALGLAFGMATFASGVMLHHMLRALDLLVAMCLYAVEDAVVQEGQHGHVADGIRLCRRLQRASSLSTLAAARGYTQAVNDVTRERFRKLRHDMRNPLGTIQSALSLMEDESVPEEARQSPRFRAMIQRNARTLDEMIVARLSDAEARSPIGAYQRISPRAVACAVRRDLRAEADARGAALVVTSKSVHYRLDAAGVELLLHDILLLALHQASEGEVLTIDFGECAEARASIEVTCAPPRIPILAVGAAGRLTTLATGLGMWFEADANRITFSFPIVPEESAGASDQGAASRSARLDGGKTGDDVGGKRQRQHG